MAVALYEQEDCGIMLNVEAWSLELCDRGGCDACPHGRDFSPVITFFYNCAIAVALAAAWQFGRVGAPIAARHHYRQNQIEKLRHQLRKIEEWAEPVEALTIEAAEMHKEVARLRAALVYIANGAGTRGAVEIAKRALDGES
jgi:hypothetical protein